MNHHNQSAKRHAGQGHNPGRKRRGVLTHGRAADAAADSVVALVSTHDRVSPDLLLHGSRCRARVAHSRQLAMYLMHTLLGRTMADVGRYFGRDRTTVAHACGRIEDERDDVGFDTLVMALEERISAQTGLGHVWH